MNAISDTWPTLAVLAPFAGGNVFIRNIEHTRWQETDRIHAVVTELRKLGVRVVEHRDWRRDFTLRDYACVDRHL